MGLTSAQYFHRPVDHTMSSKTPGPRLFQDTMDKYSSTSQASDLLPRTKSNRTPPRSVYQNLDMCPHHRPADDPGSELCQRLPQSQLTVMAVHFGDNAFSFFRGCGALFPVGVHQRAPDGKISGMRGQGRCKVSGMVMRDVPGRRRGAAAAAKESDVENGGIAK